ncbi:MAG: RHS repeat-associated core domain-containing protein, partial [Terriglobales bacterium]
VNTIYYYHADPLGTPRAITTAAGANLMNCAQHADQPNGSMLTYAPFGAAVGGCDQSAQPYNFTGQYRDAESTLDDFGARFYQSNLGRFLSPDWSDAPEPVPYASLQDPQSLNLYSYVQDNPATATDLDGHCCNWLKKFGSALYSSTVGAAWNVVSHPLATAEGLCGLG